MIRSSLFKKGVSMLLAVAMLLLIIPYGFFNLFIASAAEGINSADAFKKIGSVNNGIGKEFQLTKDITLNWGRDFVDEFSGTLDGNGYTIFVENGDPFAPLPPTTLFAYYGLIKSLTNGGTLKNLRVVVKNKLTCDDLAGANVYIGLLAGYMFNGATIQDSVIIGGQNAELYAQNYGANEHLYMGSIVGSMQTTATVTNCFSDLNLNVYENCDNTNVDGNEHYVGGIAGEMQLYDGTRTAVTDCLYSGDIKGGQGSTVGQMCFFGGGIIGSSQIVNGTGDNSASMVVQRNYCTTSKIEMNRDSKLYTNASAIALMKVTMSNFSYPNINNNYAYKCKAVTIIGGIVHAAIFTDKRGIGRGIEGLPNSGENASTTDNLDAVLNFPATKYVPSADSNIPNLKIAFDLEYKKPVFTVEQDAVTKDIKAAFSKAAAALPINSPTKLSELDKSLQYRYTYKTKEKLQTPQSIDITRTEGKKKGDPIFDNITLEQLASNPGESLQYQCKAITKNVTIPPTWSVTSNPVGGASITPKGVLSLPSDFGGEVTITATCGSEANNSITRKTHKVTAPANWTLNGVTTPINLLEGSKLSITAKPDMTNLYFTMGSSDKWQEPTIGWKYQPILTIPNGKQELATLKLIQDKDQSAPPKTLYAFEGNNGEFNFNLTMPNADVTAADFNLKFKLIIEIGGLSAPLSGGKSGNNTGANVTPPVGPHSGESVEASPRAVQDVSDWKNTDTQVDDTTNPTFRGEFIDFIQDAENPDRRPEWLEASKSKYYWYRVSGGEWSRFPTGGIDMKKGDIYQFRYEKDGYTTSDISSYKVTGNELSAWTALSGYNLGTPSTEVPTEWKYVDKTGAVEKVIPLIKGTELQPGSSYTVEAMYAIDSYSRPKDCVAQNQANIESILQKPTISLIKRERVYKSGELESDTLVDTIKIENDNAVSNMGSAIYYTINGGAETLYQKPIDFPYTVSSMVIRAWTRKTGFTDSNIVVETFTKANHSLANMPSVKVISKQAGSPPTEEFSDPNKFTETGWGGSDCPITQSEFPMKSKIQIANVETAFPNGNTDKSVKIYYTLDGSVPTSNSNLYDTNTGIILPDTITGEFRLRTFISSDSADTQIREIRVKIRGDYQPPLVKTVSGRKNNELTTKEELIFGLAPEDVAKYFAKPIPEVAPQIVVSVTTVDGKPLDNPIVRTVQTEINAKDPNNIKVETPTPVNLNSRAGQKINMTARVVGTIQGAAANSPDIDIPFETKGAAPSPISTPASGSVLPDTADPIFLDGLVNSTMYYSSKKISLTNDFTQGTDGEYTLKDSSKSYVNKYDPSKGIAIPSGIATGRFTFYAITIPEANTGYEPSLLGSYGFTFAKIPFIYPVTASQPSGEVAKGSQIVLRSTTPNAVIFYSLTTFKPNGDSDITINNTVYDGTPIIIDKETVITAYAEKEGIRSSTETFYYEIAKSIPAPSPSIASGSVVAKGTVITLSGSSRGNVIYTKDGSDPSTPGNKNAIIGNQIIIDGELGKSMTFRAYCSGTGYTPSPVITLAYTISDVNGGIVAYPAPDEKSPVKNGSVVTLTSPLTNAKIYYTTDGEVPTTASEQGTLVTVKGTPGSPFTIKAIAVADETSIPVHVTFTYTLQQRAQQPAINGIPSGSIVLPGAKISMSAKEGTVYYTMDGSTPTAASQQYVDKIELTSSVVVKAVTILPGMEVSDVTEAVYTFAGISSPPVSDKAAGKIDAGTKIALSTTTEGATIYYSTNSVDPTVANLKEMFVYTDPITITRAVTIKMIAYKKGMQPSAVNTLIYTVNEPPPPPPPETEVDEVLQTTTDRLASRRNFANKDEGPMFTEVVLKSETAVSGILSGETQTISKDSILDIQPLQPFPTDTKAVNNKLGNYDIVSMYDVNVLEDGVIVQPKGEVEVGFPIPTGYENSVLVVCSLNNDGTVENLKTRRSGGMAYVVSETLGKYAIVAPSKNSSGKFQFTPMLIAFMLVVLACIACFTFLIVRKILSKREQNR